MSDKDESTPFSFSAADLMPEWAQESTKSDKPQKKKTPPQYRDYDPGDRKNRGGQRHDRRGGQQGDRRGGGNRQGGSGRNRRDFGGGGGRGTNRRGGGQGRGAPRGRDDRNRGGRERREDPIPRGFTLKFEPTAVALAALNKHIRETFRTYPLIDLAKMIINSRERYQIEIKAESDKGARLFQCKSDGSIWLNRDEAMSHFLGNRECLASFYAVEEVDIGAPKGNFSVVAVCGLSGVILGPPNHHEYQTKIAHLHAERFSHMDLEGFKSRIHMANDEETIEKWKEQVSRTLHYRLKSDEPEETSEETEDKPLAGGTEESATETEVITDAETTEEIPAEEGAEAEEAESEETAEEESSPVEKTEETDSEVSDNSEEESEPASEEIEEDALLLKTQEELKLHFRENFAAEEISETDAVTVSGNIPGKLLSRGLLNLIKKEAEQLRRGFPLPMIQAICSGLEKHHLRFFKRGKKSLHVSAIRPKAISKSVVLTDRIKKILDLVSLPQRVDVSSLLEALVEDFKKPTTKEEADKMELSDAAKEVLTDLRWLTSEGLVLEFPDTRLSLGRMPQQQPGKKTAQKKPQEKKNDKEDVKSKSNEGVAPEKEVKPEPIAKTGDASPSTKGEANESIAEMEDAKDESSSGTEVSE